MTLALANELEAHAVALQLGQLMVQRLDEQVHQRLDFGARSLPVFAAECEQGERLDIAAHTFLDAQAHRLDSGAVPCMTFLSPQAGPPAIAVHDDRDMTRLRRGGHRNRSAVDQTCRISFSLPASCCSISATALSVSFWMSSSPRRSSSC